VGGGLVLAQSKGSGREGGKLMRLHYNRFHVKELEGLRKESRRKREATEKNRHHVINETGGRGIYSGRSGGRLKGWFRPSEKET